MKRLLIAAAVSASYSFAAAAQTTATPEQFGAAGDCNADDTAALVKMRNALRVAQATNSPATIMSLGKGKCYKYTNNRWTWGLKHLRIVGNGAWLQMVGTPTSIFGTYPLVTGRGVFQTTGIDSPFSAVQGRLIAAVMPGATEVTALTASDAASFAPGQWALVYSYNQLTTGGFPPDARYFDFVKVVSANARTGVIALDRALAHRHSATFPEVALTERDSHNQTWVGRARILPIGTDVPFSEYFYMENLTIVDNPNARRGGDGPGADDPLFKSHNYLLVSGAAHAVLSNVNGSELVPSTLGQLDVIGGTFWAAEADKIVHQINFNDTVLNGTGLTVGLTECTGTDEINWIGGSIHEVVCAPRAMSFRGVKFSNPDVSNYATFINVGFPTTRISISDSQFTGGGGTSVPIRLNGTIRLLVDGTNVTVSANTVTVVNITGQQPTSAPPANFMRCVEPGGYIGLVKKGTSAEIAGTISDILGNGRNGAEIPVAPSSNSVATGDTLLCRPVMAANVSLSNNTYSGYGIAAPQLPSR